MQINSLRSYYYIWSFILVTSLVVTGLSIKFLSLEGITHAQNLISRGGVCLIICAVLAFKMKLSLIPKNPRAQMLRALVAGLALSLITVSYSYLSASTVAVLSNMDVPLLMLLAPLMGGRSNLRTNILSLSSLIMLIIYVLGMSEQSGFFLGLLFLVLGTLLLCFGYHFIKKSMGEENRLVTIAVPSIAIMIFGFLQNDQGLFLGWNLEFILIAITAGVGMFYAYFATMKLYAKLDLAQAEFVGLFATLIIWPIETFLFQIEFIPQYYFCTLIFVGMTYLILNQRETT